MDPGAVLDWVDFVTDPVFLQALGNTAPVYLLSSVGDGLSMTVDHSELGVRGILQKPLLPSALLALVRATLT